MVFANDVIQSKTIIIRRKKHRKFLLTDFKGVPVIIDPQLKRVKNNDWNTLNGPDLFADPLPFVDLLYGLQS